MSQSLPCPKYAAKLPSQPRAVAGHRRVKRRNPGSDLFRRGRHSCLRIGRRDSATLADASLIRRMRSERLGIRVKADRIPQTGKESGTMKKRLANALLLGNRSIEKAVKIGLLSVLLMGYTVAGVIPGRWDKVDRLPAGTAIILETASQGVLEGSLAAFDDSGLTLHVEDRLVHLPKSEILKVSTGDKRSGSGGKGALTGAAIGGASLALFLALAAAADDCTPGIQIVCVSPGQGAAVGGAIGGGVGALIGFGVAKSRKSREVLYVAARP